MSDALSLRSLLRKIDGSAPAIQATAGAMMKHYDKSSGVAVVEWRNALHQARGDQHLPLLYVANEVLQNSKRNRGNKFLEAFSPTLGQSLVFISQNHPSVVEKVRRTIKIWGDRHVFSIRFVNELLKGMEPFRNDGPGGGGAAGAAIRKPPPQTSPVVPGGFSPLAKPQSNSPEVSTPASKNADFDKEMSLDADDDDVYPDVSDDDDDASDGDLFGDASERILNINVDLDQAAASATSSSKATNRKRRRPNSLNASGSNAGSSSKSPRRKSILSTNSLMELWTQVSTLQQSYDHVQTMLSDLTPEYLDEASASSQIETLVGDELLQQYKQVIQYERRVVDQRRELHGVAQNRRALEMQAVRYLPWLEGTLQQDQDDVAFSDKLQKQLESFLLVHGKAKDARDIRLQEEARRQKEQEELNKKKQEEEERKKFMESAMTKVSEAQPGMVWNRATGEYQHLQTDESWRD
jgi:hypothetical protein